MSERPATPQSLGDLPADLAQVRTLLLEMIESGQAADAVELIVRLLGELRGQNTALGERLKLALKRLYGRSSEKISRDQLKLFIDALLDAPSAADSPAPTTPADSAADGSTPGAGPSGAEPTRRPSNHKGRRPLPAHLPREIVVLPVAEEDRICPVCGKERTCIGHEISEVLELVPASFKVLEFRREKRACDPLCDSGVVIAPVADKVIDGGLPGPALFTDVLVKKYQDHIPLGRMNKIYRRGGVEIPDSTLADWVAAGAALLDPIAQLYQKRVLEAVLLSTDDTGIRVLDRKDERGIKKGHLWLYIGDGKYAAYVYTPTWEGKGPQGFLEKRTGYVQGDGYKGYEKVFARPDIIEVGCMAHARRKLVEALEAGDLRAAAGLEWIGNLYDIEEEARQGSLGVDGWLRLRQERSRPIADKLEQWMKSLVDNVPPKTPLGRALGYALARWKALTRFLEDGRLPIDNTHVERQLRQPATGRKNWLFCGSDEGARRAAIIYTMLVNCELAGVDPAVYLRDVIEKLSRGWPKSRIAELLAPEWAKQHRENTNAQPDARPVPR